MKEGVPVKGEDFFKLLYGDDEFCRELGRAILAGSRLETGLKTFLSAHNVDTGTKKSTLGQLLHLMRKHEILVKWLPALETLVMQRNYLMHNVHALFAGVIEETVLPRTDLLDSDIDLYTERAKQLEENLSGVYAVLKEMIDAPNQPATSDTNRRATTRDVRASHRQR